MLSTCLASNKMYYSVQLVLPNVMWCHAIAVTFGLGFEHLDLCLACQALCLELLSLESKAVS